MEGFETYTTALAALGASLLLVTAGVWMRPIRSAVRHDRWQR
jgi:hypothetical protein